MARTLAGLAREQRERRVSLSELVHGDRPGEPPKLAGRPPRALSRSPRRLRDVMDPDPTRLPDD